MKIALGSDHGGFALKAIVTKELLNLGYEIEDVGCHSLESVDYPDYAHLVISGITGGNCDCGILICGTGIGMSIAANRNPQIRAALCHDEYTARMSREHNDANILCLGARVIGEGVALDLIKVWLSTSFAGGRHQQRLAKLSTR
ncbi:MAG: ribose 5-phosphate isomerase B [Desulfobulbaceae bacterium]|nr:MAG: ribose 5-phosphate isomerase B [Desulfobulbaceae bacterium]